MSYVCLKCRQSLPVPLPDDLFHSAFHRMVYAHDLVCEG